MAVLVQVFKIYLRWLTGTISWWKPPEGTVFNIPLFTGWEQALVKKIPMSWWKKLTFQAMIRFNKWLYPRPRLFKWLNVCLPHMRPLNVLQRKFLSILNISLQIHDERPELDLSEPWELHAPSPFCRVYNMSTPQGFLKAAIAVQEHGVPVLVYILNRPEDWDVGLKLEGITAIMTDSPSALAEYLTDK